MPCARYSAVRRTYADVDTSDHREAYLSITLAWHQVVSAHLVDVGDREPR